MQTHRYKICVCKTKSCSERFSRDIKAKFEELVQKQNLADRIVVDDGGCYGRCTIGPNVFIIGPIPDDLWDAYRTSNISLPGDGPPRQIYVGVSPNDCKELLESHCLKGIVVSRLAEKTA